jgi:hypothetical protein
MHQMGFYYPNTSQGPQQHGYLASNHQPMYLHDLALTTFVHLLERKQQGHRPSLALLLGSALNRLTAAETTMLANHVGLRT